MHEEIIKSMENKIANLEKNFGKPEDWLQTTADLWSVWLSHRHGEGTIITVEEVAIMLSLLNLAKQAQKFKESNLLNAAMYSMIALENEVKSFQRSQDNAAH